MIINRFRASNDSSTSTHLRLTISLLAVLLIAGCQSMDQERAGMAEGAAIDTTAILASVNNLRSSYQNAVNSGDMETLSGLVTEDAKMVQPGTADWDAMREAAMGPFPAGSNITITPMETHVINNDWVYEMGSSTITYTPEGSGEAVTLGDTYLVILKRTADGWKVHREVASAMQLPATTSE